MPRAYKTKEQHKAFAKAVKAGATIKDALIGAGYTERQARKGRAALSEPLKQALAHEVGKDFAERVALGRKVKVDDIRAAVMGNLALGLAERSDAGVQMTKLAGSLKELRCWESGSVTGVIVLDFPRSLPEPELPVLDAEEVKMLPE